MLITLMYTIPVMQIASKVNSRELGKFQSEGRRNSPLGGRQTPSLRQQMNTQVTFDSEVFNTSQVQARYARPGNYGDDAARWLMGSLQELGAEVDRELGQDYHGWYFSFLLSGIKYEFTMGWNGHEWQGSLERSVGLVSTILGGRSRGISKTATGLIDEALKSKAGIYNIRWAA